MENPALGSQLKALFLMGAGLLLAIFIGLQIGSAGYGLLLLATAFIALAAFTLFSGRFFWVVAIAASSLAGTFPVLGGSFTAFQVLMAIGVAKFLIEDVVFRRTTLKAGDRLDLFLILAFMAVITWHGVGDRFGMRYLGSTVWGGRHYVNVYVGLAAYFVIQSIPMKSKIWSKLPYVMLAIASFDLTIALVTTIFPRLIYTIYPFYSAVSRTGVEEILSGAPIETTRLSVAGGFGITLISLVLASTPLQQVLHPARFFRLCIFGIGALAVLLSSFRSAVFNAIAVVVIAGIRDLKWAALGLLPFLAIGLFGLSFVNSEVFAFPKPIQRSLTFLPGDWDADLKRGAVGSNEWRKEIWSLFLEDYFPRHPWLGRGFGFQSQWAEQSVYRYDPESNRQNVEVGNIHNGFLACLDTFGIVGTIFFVAWNIRLFIRTLQIRLRPKDPAGLALPFLALSLGALIVCFWTSAANVGVFLPQEFALAAVFGRLLKDRASDEFPVTEPSASAKELIQQPAFGRV